MITALFCLWKLFGALNLILGTDSALAPPNAEFATLTVNDACPAKELGAVKLFAPFVADPFTTL